MDADVAVKRLYERFAGNGSTADAIHDAVAEGILSRMLPPGSRLGEERLAALFSVSRTPVREALMRLESENLAARNRRSGLVVADVSAEQILEIYVIREALDGVAARQAAHFHSGADIAALERINDQIERAAAEGAFPRMASLNVEFHTALARASRNQILQRFVDQVHQAVRRFTRTTFSEPGRAQEAVSEHRQIIDAVKAQDEELAERVARAHMHNALNVRMAMELDRGIDSDS
ncbi:MAG TPA: GntR family transcriptional regulator [Candidatus Limnocylindria bacterium]|nr:GntR family transcriptional regulator [Candidatus Limnocylindria bacterium]